MSWLCINCEGHWLTEDAAAAHACKSIKIHSGDMPDPRDAEIAALNAKLAAHDCVDAREAMMESKLRQTAQDTVRVLQGKLTERDAEIARLKRDLDVERDVLESLKNRSRCKSPCGHNSQYAYTEDGGKNIRCLICQEIRLTTELAEAKAGAKRLLIALSMAQGALSAVFRATMDSSGQLSERQFSELSTALDCVDAAIAAAKGTA